MTMMESAFKSIGSLKRDIICPTLARNRSSIDHVRMAQSRTADLLKNSHSVRKGFEEMYKYLHGKLPISSEKAKRIVTRGLRRYFLVSHETDPFLYIDYSVETDMTNIFSTVKQATKDMVESNFHKYAIKTIKKATKVAGGRRQIYLGRDGAYIYLVARFIKNPGNLDYKVWTRTHTAALARSENIQKKGNTEYYDWKTKISFPDGPPVWIDTGYSGSIALDLGADESDIFLLRSHKKTIWGANMDHGAVARLEESYPKPQRSMVHGRPYEDRTFTKVEEAKRGRYDKANNVIAASWSMIHNVLFYATKIKRIVDEK